MQELFNPVDYTFKWVDGWYEFDSSEGIRRALADRRQRAKQLRREGYSVRNFSLGKQQITRGGIGSGHPQIDVVVPVYGLNYS